MKRPDISFKNQSSNAITVLERRYLKKDEQGKPIEAPEDMFWRVAVSIAKGDLNFMATEQQVYELACSFYEMMVNCEFLPNSPTLMNAGRDLGQLSACFVLPIEDSMEGIFETLKHTALIHRSGGGTGFSFSRLRPKNDRVKRTSGVSSGPVSFMKIFDTATEHVKQGGCFGPNERISTDKGLITVKELADYIDNGVVIKAHTHKGLRQITCCFRNGNKQLYTVVTKRGYKVNITADHKVAVLVDGKIETVKLDCLKPGDEILLLLGNGTETEETELKSITYNRSVMSTTLNENVKLPTTLNKDLAYLLGYVYGNGSVRWDEQSIKQTPKGLQIATPEAYPAIHDRLIRVIRDLFSIEPTVTKGDGAVLLINLYSRIIVEWLKSNNLLKEKAENIKVPEILFRAPSSVTAAFIAGYFDADGCDRGKKGGFGIDSISSCMLEGIQQLLGINGILAHITKQERSVANWRPLYRLIITGSLFKQRFVDFVPAEKVTGTDAKRDVYNTYPANVLKAIGSRSKHYDGIYDYVSERISFNQLYKIYQRTVRYNDLSVAENIKHLMNTMPDEIVSIDQGVTSEVYDFEVDDIHLLSGNGIYTSNSRRGANMGILRVDHPDIMEFIYCKENGGIQNFNISVAITDKFIEALENDEYYSLVNPRTSATVERLKAKDVFDAIANLAWKTGDPGLVFIDRMNESNPTPSKGKYEATNPCGEQNLLPYDSCNLGSYNLSEMVVNGDIDWDKLKRTVQLAVHFLDNVVEVNKYPLPEIEAMNKGNRRIGLGPMGVADMLFKLKLGYNTPEGVDMIDTVLSFVSNVANETSRELGSKRGGYPHCELPSHAGRRNAATTTVAPTGTISMIAGCSSGIEPLFALAFVKNVMDNTPLLYIDPYFEQVAKERGFHSKELMTKVAEHGSVQGLSEVPEDVRKVFVTSHDITPEWHIKAQAAAQANVENSVSKTINMPHTATVEDVRNAYRMAFTLGCKGVTIYRDGCKDVQVLNVGSKDPNKKDAVAEHTIKPRKRPAVVSGKTPKVETGCGHMYVTVNNDDAGEPFEVFAQIGKTGGCASAQTQAITRLASLALRSGVDPKEIANQIQGIRCPIPKMIKGVTILSCPDAIGKVLNGTDIANNEVNVTGNNHRGEVVGMCPDCGGVLKQEEGCASCQSCGFSKCGG
jgi:ribonucleoside-diphosphate reductase alpha chain